MTINDIDLNACCLKIEQLANLLKEYQRDGKELALFMALSDIERAANKAQVRLNERKFKCS